MSPLLQQLISGRREAGQRDYARWDEKLFQPLCRGPVEYFWEKTAHDLVATEGYLSALAEGIGRNYVTQSADPKHHQFFATYLKWRSLLEFWLVLRIPLEFPALKSAEDHYTQGVALMNLGRWDEAREHFDRARKSAPKAYHIVYAMAALDCLTGEADSALENLKLAIQLRPENRYHARNDEDFSFLQEDPRFTELLYPEKDGLAG